MIEAIKMLNGLMAVDQVLEYLLGQAECLVREEQIPISNALHRILAKDLESSIAVPLVDSSAMDGYAVASNGLSAGDLLPVSDRIPAGYVGDPWAPGTAARIFTGAPLPQGADAVVIQENTETQGDQVRIIQIPCTGENIRPAGQDIQQGATILKAGRKLQAQDLGLAVSVGCAEVFVKKPLKVAVLATGDELMNPPQTLAPGQIYNSSHYMLMALLRQLGMTPVDVGLVADDLAATRLALNKAALRADCILSTGGVSVGEEDHVKTAVSELGHLDIWRLAIKPGKPLAFGKVQGTPFFGLPGNPVSAFVTFMIIARPYLLASQGCSERHLPAVYGRADFNLTGGSRREYLRVRLDCNHAGENRITIFAHQGSGVMSSVSWANGLALVEVGQSISPGDLLKVYLLP